MCKKPGVDRCDHLSPEEWILIGDAVLKSLPAQLRSDNLDRYFYCNIGDATYVIDKDYNAASSRYAQMHILPFEGWPIFGVVIQEQHC